MKEQQRGLALVILGVVAVIAIVGLVLMFSGAKKSAGAVPTLFGDTLPSGFCDSPCTAGFGASEAEAWNQVKRFVDERDFVPIGPTKVVYTPFGQKQNTICVCPKQLTPFPPTSEEGQVVYKTPYAPRLPGVPSPQGAQVPAGTGPYAYGNVPSYPYPASINK